MSSAVPQPNRLKTAQPPQIPTTSEIPLVVPVNNPKFAPPPRPLHPIIEIISGYKHFGFSKKWRQAMKNVNLMAYAGQVYVLLGPEGSGKTSIVDVILGFTALSHGYINVFGVKPGGKHSGCPGPRIGYAPQSNGLFKYMTITETFKYYGNMLGLKSNYINQRICFLNDLFALPKGKLFISQCDENQKRQISFAIAILHEPELLLLDEPCQGVDPVCRTNMWDHLKALVEKGVTVFLTTQLLPDAHRADRLGILRNGYLLMEGSPSELIHEYKENSIETLYTSIYSLRIKKGKLDEKRSIHEHPRIKIELVTTHGSEGFICIEEPTDNQITMNKKLHSRKSRIGFYCQKMFMKLLPNCKRLLPLLSRDIRLAFRCYVRLLSVCLVPIILVILFTLTVGEPPKDLKMGVVNYETHEDCNNPNISENHVSCQVLSLIDSDTIITTNYNAYEDAKSDAYKMKILAILIVGEKFTSQLIRMLAGAFSGKAVDQSSPNTAQLILQLDMTNKVVASTIEHAVKRAVEKYLLIATKEGTVRNVTIGYPIFVGQPIFGDEKSTDNEFICLGLMVVVLYYLASFLVASTMVSYRVCHLAVRDYVAGVRLIESILSQMVVYGLLLVIEALLMYLVLALMRNLNISITWEYLTVVFVQVWCGLCFGFFIASVTRSGVQAGCIVFCCLATSMILCGVLWPLNGQPHWLLTIVNLLPHTQTITAVRCIIQKGVSINQEEVYLGIVIPLVWLILFVLLTYIFTKY